MTWNSSRYPRLWPFFLAAFVLLAAGCVLIFFDQTYYYTGVLLEAIGSLVALVGMWFVLERV